MRIVSLVPSLTELVDSLGRGEWLVGRTKFCTEPRRIRRVEAIGGTKDPDIARVLALAPELVIGNKEENRQEDIEALWQAGIDVLLTDPNSVADATRMIEELGQRLEALDAARQLTSEIERTIGELPVLEPRPAVFVAVWRRPLLGLGGESYGNDVITSAGGRNELAGRPRYPGLSPEELAQLKPDLVLLPDEPFRFQQRHVREFAHIAPARVIDGKLLWWYGPRIPGALRELNAMLREVGTVDLRSQA